MPPTESQTRSQLIDPQLVHAGWRLNDPSQVRFEVPVDGYDAEPWNGVTDYCLYDPAGEVLAVVEAKRTSRSAREGEEQLRHYITEIATRQRFAPFGFLANGGDTYFWEVGVAHPRLVAGFFAPDDLLRFERFSPGFFDLIIFDEAHHPICSARLPKMSAGYQPMSTRTTARLPRFNSASHPIWRRQRRSN